ncbi:MAG: YncE family protein [Nitrospirota bacterium]
MTGARKRTGTARSIIATLAAFALVGCASARGPLLYVADPDSDGVVVVDPTGRAPLVRVPEILKPWDVAVSPDGKTVYVGGRGRSVAAIRTDTHAITRVDAGGLPQAVDVSSDGRALFVANVKDHTVSVISTKTGALLAQPRVGPRPVAVAAIPRRPAVYVVSYFSGTVSVVSTVTYQLVETIPVGQFPVEIAVSIDGRFAYVTNQGSAEVSVIDTARDVVVATVPVGVNPTGIAMSPDGGVAYVANGGSDTVSVVSTASDRELAAIPVGPSPWGVAVSPDGGRVYVTHRGTNRIAVIDAAARHITAWLDTDAPDGLLGIAVVPR